MSNQGNFFALLEGEEVEEVPSLLERLEEKRKAAEDEKRKAAEDEEKKKKAAEDEQKQRLQPQTQQQKSRSRQSNNSAANSRSASYNGRGKEGHSRGPGTNMEGSGRRQPISSQSNSAPLNGHQGNGVTNGHQRNYGQDNGYYADSSNGNYRRYDNNYQQVNRQAWQAGHGDQYDNAQYKGNQEEGRMGYGGDGSFRDGNGRQQNHGRRIYVEKQQSNGGRDYSGDGRSNGGNYHNGNQSEGSVTSEGSRGVKPEGEDQERSFWKRLETMPDEEREAFFKRKAEKATENSFWARMQKKTAEERKACCKEKFEEEEAEKKKKTLKEYEEELLEKKAQLEASKTEERKVAIDKELVLMKPMKKKGGENVLNKQSKKDGTKSKDGDKRRSLNISEFHEKYQTSGTAVRNIRGPVDVKKYATSGINVDDEKHFPDLPGRF